MIAFIVLNYNNFEDTKKCIESLLVISKDTDNEIIVVDNASTDRSAYQLEVCFSGIQHISFVINEENYGFSKGNNIGCKFALTKFNVDFLCVINNDTYIKDMLFCKKLEKNYSNTLFDILAPCVWNQRKNYNQNPFYCPCNINEVVNEMKIIKKGLKYLKLGIIPFYLFSKFTRRKVTGKSLSGAACIFSKKYFAKYEEVFIEKTFMYNEEAFLYQRILRDNLNLVFDNDIVIFHSDACSTRKIYNSKKKKWKFQNENILAADEILLNYLKESGK